MTELETFQTSPDGIAYAAVFGLQNAIDDLRATPPAILNKYRDDIAVELLRLADVAKSMILEIAA